MSKEQVEASKTIKTEDGDVKKTGAVLYDVGDDLDEMVDLIGAERAYQFAKREIHRKLQSAIRRELASGTDPENVPEQLKDWRPDKPHSVSKNPEQAGVEAFEQMSADAQLEHIEKLKKKLAQAKAG